MELLVSIADVKNELDIDLEKEFGKTSQHVDKWLGSQQREILNHIARYAYGGMVKVEAYLLRPQARQIIKQAILEQINFLAHNNFVEAKYVADMDVANKMRDIAPMAHEILLNAGLLYSGAY